MANNLLKFYWQKNHLDFKFVGKWLRVGAVLLILFSNASTFVTANNHVIQKCFGKFESSIGNEVLVPYSSDGSIHLIHNSSDYKSNNRDSTNSTGTITCRYTFITGYVSSDNSSGAKQEYQIRLDFTRFLINQGPLLKRPIGDCMTDTLTFSGASELGLKGPLCGDLSGQHMYLHNEATNGSETGPEFIVVTIVYTPLNPTGNLVTRGNDQPDALQPQNWDIVVTWIPLGNNYTLQAPRGCLQYFMEKNGTVQSFNYNLQQQLNNQGYTVCIRTFEGMSTITWQSSGGPYDFFMTGLPPILAPSGSGFQNLTRRQISKSGESCDQDWVAISGDTKYCGNEFDGPVTSQVQPFTLQVHCNEYELGPTLLASSGRIGRLQVSYPGNDDRNTGFSLVYTQHP